jgi:hypothetical protein
LNQDSLSRIPNTPGMKMGRYNSVIITMKLKRLRLWADLKPFSSFRFAIISLIWKYIITTIHIYANGKDKPVSPIHPLLQKSLHHSSFSCRIAILCSADIIKMA